MALFASVKIALKRLTKQRTDLERILSVVTVDTARMAFKKERNAEDGVVAAISALVLFAANEFATQVIEMCAKAPGRLQGRPPSYDVLVFEAAAYCHYRLMADELRKERLSVDIARALDTTSSIIGKHTRFNLSDEFFAGRAGSYSIPRERSIAEEANHFGGILLDSLQAQRPVMPSATLPLSDQLDLYIAVHTSIGIFHQTILKGVLETIERLREAYL